MPHDAKGNPLSPGDQVLVRCKVREILAGEEYCNATLETIESMYPGETKTLITINTRQTEKV